MLLVGDTEMRILLSLVLLALFVPVTVSGPAPPTVEEQVDALFAPLIEGDLISGSVLIARGGRVEVAKGYGPANREHDVPCTEDTRYRLASMTKSFTAMALMILESRDALSVEDTLDKYIPDYPEGDKITLHHLLTHTAGVINYSALPDHYKAWAMPHTIDEVIARFRDEPLRFTPGERFEYSNSGYVLLTYVIEKVSGMSYAEFLQQNIFAPLGMRDSGADSHTTIIPHRATGHYNFGDGVVQARYLEIEFTSGAGGLYSTVHDLYKWDRALYTDKLVPLETLQTMFTPVEASYGYGWFIREALGHKLIEHRGGINGFLTMIQRFVDDDVVVVSLFNYVSTFTRDVNRALAAIALGEEYTPVLIPEGVEVPERVLRELAGSYRLGDSTLTIALEEGRLWLVDSELERSETIPQSESRLFSREANALLDFPRGEDGGIERMIVRQSERVIPCPRVESP
jgi:CubicO group peptidase (beta-lactamase class C family)